MEAIAAPRLSAVLTVLTPKQKTFLLHYIVSGDERAARAVVAVNEQTWIRWKKEPEFLEAKKLAGDRVFHKSEAMSELCGAVLPRVMGDILEMAQKPWDKLFKGQDKAKMWAIGLVMDIAGEKHEPKSVVSFRDVILNLEERVSGKVVDGEYKVLGGVDAVGQGN